ncbi:MAG: fused MFS/spermidine synthase [Oceanospirillaceae bacterium]
MNTPKYLYTQTDEYGDIAVMEEGDCRILSFGVGDEQSIQLTQQPHLLQHAYTQAMMMSLLFCEPKRVLLLGLGAGSLLQAMRHSVAGVRIEAVEIRQAVIDIAKKYFRLPTSKKISLHCEDASAYLKRGVSKKVDLIMTDLYTDEGMQAVQVSNEYIDLCTAQLKVNGWLVLNCWGRENDHSELLSYLRKQYADVRSCESGDGNLIIFAGRQKDGTSAPDLRTAADRLSLTVGFSLQRYLGKLG